MSPRQGQDREPYLRLIDGDGEGTRKPSLSQSQEDIAELMHLVGDRVRHLRKSKALSRRALSEKSNVSTRYLAKLEGGNGNISIGLLKRLSVALEIDIEQLLSDSAPIPEDARVVAASYGAADAETRANVRNLLGIGNLQTQKGNRICLVGLRGAGKTTLGTGMSQLFGVPFVELNQQIEDRAGMPIADIIALYGQEGYRELEAKALDDLILAEGRVILAVGGGIVANETTYDQLRAQFHTIWLRASPNDYMERVRAQGDLRPMDGNEQAMQQLHQILRERERLYAMADFTLDTKELSVEESLEQLAKLVRNNGLLFSALTQEKGQEQ